MSPTMTHALRKYRDDNGITLDVAATALKVSAANLSRIENGHHAASADLMRRIAEWSGNAVTPNDLLRIVHVEAAE